MKAAYDHRLVSIANTLGKKYGAKVGTVELPGAGPVVARDGSGWESTGGEVHGPATVHSLDITPAMAEDAMGGMQMLFQPGKDKDRRASIKFDRSKGLARAYTINLFRGADVSNLRNAFARIKAWMIALYKNNVANLRVEISPEIRGVFDRLVAAEDATDQAEAAHGMDVTLPPEAFDSLADWEKHRQSVVASRAATSSRLEAELLETYQQEASKAWKEQRAEVQADVRSTRAPCTR
jgi:hypothetical protein